MSKYRIWDGQKMHYRSCRFLIDTSDGTIVENVGDDQGGDSLVYRYDYKAQLLLGFRDANDLKGFHEGDIVKVSASQIYDTYPPSCYFLGRLELEQNKGLILKDVILHTPTENTSERRTDVFINPEKHKVEVVGNILENPDMLDNADG